MGARQEPLEDVKKFIELGCPEQVEFKVQGNDGVERVSISKKDFYPILKALFRGSESSPKKLSRGARIAQKLMPTTCEEALQQETLSKVDEYLQEIAHDKEFKSIQEESFLNQPTCSPPLIENSRFMSCDKHNLTTNEIVPKFTISEPAQTVSEVPASSSDELQASDATLVEAACEAFGFYPQEANIFISSISSNEHRGNYERLLNSMRVILRRGCLLHGKVRSRKRKVLKQLLKMKNVIRASLDSSRNTQSNVSDIADSKSIHLNKSPVQIRTEKGSISVDDILDCFQKGRDTMTSLVESQHSMYKPLRTFG